MKDNWTKSCDLVIESEGGYKLTTIPGDLGGQTYAGIARVPNPHWEGWALIDKGDMPPKEMVWAFYKTQVWDKVRGDELPVGVDYMVYDFAVNAGISRAVKTLQQAVGAVADGALGPATLKAIEGYPAEELIKKYSEVKEAFYHGIVASKPEQVKFLKGWLNRVAHVGIVADTMLA
jgi:lysozyme family protein